MELKHLPAITTGAEWGCLAFSPTQCRVCGLPFWSPQGCVFESLDLPLPPSFQGLIQIPPTPGSLPGFPQPQRVLPFSNYYGACHLHPFFPNSILCLHLLKSCVAPASGCFVTATAKFFPNCFGPNSYSPGAGWTGHPVTNGRPAALRLA